MGEPGENEYLMRPEKREDFFKGFEDPGGFTREQMGANPGNPYLQNCIILPSSWNIAKNSPPGRIIYHPDTETTAYMYEDKSECPFFQYVPLGHYYYLLKGELLPFERELIESTSPGMLSWKRGKVPRNMVDYNWASVEGSFAVDNFNDMLYVSRFGMIYNLAEANAPGGSLWRMDPQEMVNYVGEFVGSHHLDNIFCLNKEEVINGVSLQDIANYIAGSSFLISEMAKRKIETGQIVMKKDPIIMNLMASYLFTTLKTELERPQDQSIFTDEELTNVLLSLAKAERAPEKLEDYFEDQKKTFSAYLNMAMDMGLRRLAPLAFAFGNRATLEAVGMRGKNYMERMKATNTFISLRGLGLEKLNELFDTSEPYYESSKQMRILKVGKSVYTAVSEALSLHQKEFKRIITSHPEYGLKLPDPNEPQLSQDFQSLIALDKLLAVWQSGSRNPDLEKLVSGIYDSISGTPDITRGTIIPQDEDMDGIVNEAMARKDIQIIAVLNYSKNGARRPFIADLKKEEDRERFFKEMGIEVGINYAEAIRKWYEIHRDGIPYGAIHLYGPTKFVPDVYGEAAVPIYKQKMEVRVIPESCRKEAYNARMPFKWDNSGHIVTG